MPGWFGGRHIVTDAGENRVLECRAADLKRGDIVVYGNLPLDEEHVKAFVYTGCEELTLADGKIVSVLDRGVTALLSYDVFAALRPTLAADPGPDGAFQGDRAERRGRCEIMSHGAGTVAAAFAVTIASAPASR